MQYMNDDPGFVDSKEQNGDLPAKTPKVEVEDEYEWWYEQHLASMREKIEGSLFEDEQPSPADAVLTKMAKQAVRNYANDRIRAGCWNAAVASVLEASA